MEIRPLKLTLMIRYLSGHDSPKFVLAPTPAQLGIAPFNRRQSHVDSNEERPKDSFFRRENDDMDRVLEQVDFKSKFSSLPEYRPDEVKSPNGVSPAMPLSGQMVSPGGSAKSFFGGSVFFGPDFNADSIKGKIIRT